MAFSWAEFVKRHRIEYVESGAHTQSGNWYVPCPWCRDGKPRLGLHLSSTAWGCWKTKKHAGTDPTRLIRALLGCSWEQAVAEAKDDSTDRSTVSALRQRLEGLDAPDDEPEEVRLPGDELASILGAVHPPESWHRAYLERRGFPGVETVRLVKRYGLAAGIAGRMQSRIVIPFRRLDGSLVGYTGRHIGKSPLRYDTVGPTRDVLFGGVQILDDGPNAGRLLAIVEGPFDAMKVDHYGREYGTRAVGLIGLGGGGTSKVSLILKVFRRGGFDSCCVLLDASARSAAVELVAALRAVVPVWRGSVPSGVKDPGDMTPRHVRALGGSAARTHGGA